MTAFAVAMTTIAADPHVGVDATWISGNGGAGVAVRVVPSREEADAFASAPMKGERARARMAISALPGRPSRGDLLAFEGQGYKIETIEQDARGVSYLLTLVRDGA